MVCRSPMATLTSSPTDLTAVQSFQIGDEWEDLDQEMEEIDGEDSDEESESRPRKKARN